MVCSGLSGVALNESAPSLRSISGKTLGVHGRKIVQLDCGNALLECAILWCASSPFLLVSVARLLFRGLWTVVAKDYFALIDSTGNPVPIVRRKTLVYPMLMPTVIPYAAADARDWQRVVCQRKCREWNKSLVPWSCMECRPCVTARLTIFCQIGALIAAAQGAKNAHGTHVKRGRSPSF